MKTFYLPCLRYGKAGDGRYDMLACADELMPYKNRIREIEFQWKAGGDKAYPSVWYLHLLPGGSYGLLMRFTDTGTEGDIRHRPHTLLKEVALCHKDRHHQIISAISCGSVPQNVCLGTNWRFDVGETEEVRSSCWRTGVLNEGTPGTYTIKASKSALPPAPPAPHPPKPRPSSKHGLLSVCGSALVLLVLLILTIYFHHEYTYYEMRCSELHAQVMELQARNNAIVNDGKKANRSWNDKEKAWQTEKSKLTDKIDLLKRENGALKKENEDLRQKNLRQTPTGTKRQSSPLKKGESVVNKVRELMN